MDEKEKYRAEIETRMTKFNETINELRDKADKRKDARTGFQMEGLLKKHEAARTKLKELKTSDENAWKRFQTELDDMLDDIDEDLREALAYFG